MNALTLIITLVVGVILTGALLGPVVNDATKTEETFTNEGYYNVSKLESTDDYTMVWSPDNPYQVVINGTDTVSLSKVPQYGAVTVVGSDEFCVRFLNTPDNPRIQVYGNMTWGFGSSSGTTFTASLSDGTLTLKNEADPAYSVSNTAPEKLYAISNDGEYVLKNGKTPAYMLGDSSLIVLCGITEATIATPGVYADGTIDGGLDFTLFRPSAQSETAVFSNESITAETVEGYVGLKSLEKIEFDVTLNEGTVEPTYTYFIVPAKVTAELSDHLTPGQISLIGAIPVMVIVALLMAAVGAIAIRRND